MSVLTTSAVQRAQLASLKSRLQDLSGELISVRQRARDVCPEVADQLEDARFAVADAARQVERFIRAHNEAGR